MGSLKCKRPVIAHPCRIFNRCRCLPCLPCLPGSGSLHFAGMAARMQRSFHRSWAQWVMVMVALILERTASHLGGQPPVRFLLCRRQCCPQRWKSRMARSLGSSSLGTPGSAFCSSLDCRLSVFAKDCVPMGVFVFNNHIRSPLDDSGCVP